MKETTSGHPPATACTAAYEEKLSNCMAKMAQLETFAHTLVESEAKSKSILEAAVDGIIIISDRGMIESFNPAAEKIFGYAREK
jgi:PAS domain-containing protein